MMNASKIQPLITTANETINILRCLKGFKSINTKDNTDENTNAIAQIVEADPRELQSLSWFDKHI